MLYFDANATSVLRPVAKEAIGSVMSGKAELANPSSIHQAGRASRALIRDARKAVFSCLGLSSKDGSRLIFTSGGTESCNAMISGFLGNVSVQNAKQIEVLLSGIEHQAVLEPIRELESLGCQVNWIPVLANCEINQTALIEAASKKTSLILLMAANNVTGVVQPVAKVARELRAKGCMAVIACDASQALGKSELDATELFNAGVDALVLSGHKLGAPSGIGALLLRANDDLCRPFSPLILGGPQEERFRAGTENLLGIVGFGAACKELIAQGESERERLRLLREKLWLGISSSFEQAVRITPEATSAELLSNTLAISFPGLRGDDIVVALDLLGLAASTGSACSSGRQEPSYVFTQMGLPKEIVNGAIRLSLDWTCTEEDVLRAIDVINEALGNLYSVWLENNSIPKESNRV